MKMFMLFVVLWMVGFTAVDYYRANAKPPQLEQPIKPVSDLVESIVRLHDRETGSFFCSGFVVNQRQVVTAAHCLVGKEEKAMNDAPSILAIDIRGVQHPVFVTAYEQSTDLGLLQGYFHTVKPIKIQTNPALIDKAFEGPLFSCGFPYGGNILCAPFIPSGKYIFKYKGESILYPGMSGGPVYDPVSDSVVALNTALSEYFKIVSPLANICSVIPCNVVPK